MEFSASARRVRTAPPSWIARGTCRPVTIARRLRSRAVPAHRLLLCYDISTRPYCYTRTLLASTARRRTCCFPLSHHRRTRFTFARGEFQHGSPPSRKYTDRDQQTPRPNRRNVTSSSNSRTIRIVSKRRPPDSITMPLDGLATFGFPPTRQRLRICGVSGLGYKPEKIARS